MKKESKKLTLKEKKSEMLLQYEKRVGGKLWSSRLVEKDHDKTGTVKDLIIEEEWIVDELPLGGRRKDWELLAIIEKKGYGGLFKVRRFFLKRERR